MIIIAYRLERFKGIAVEFGSFGEGFGLFGASSATADIITLSDLNPFAVYASTDIMESNQPIVRLRRASDASEQDFTEAELWGSAYDTFASGTIARVAKIYNQVVGGNNSSNSHLQMNTVGYQPLRGQVSERSISFQGDFVHSHDISAISGRPDFDGDISLGARYKPSNTNNTSYDNPLFTYYNASSGGFGFNYVPVHGAAHRQLTTRITGGEEVYKADDYGSSLKTADITFGDVTSAGKSILSTHISQTSRRVRHDGASPVDNTDDCGTITEPAVTRFGIGGWRVGPTFRSSQQHFSLSCACIFDRTLDLEDQSSLISILNGLSV